MTTTSYSLFDFLSGCGGNWRNAVFIPCPPCAHFCKANRCGGLLSADSQGRPILITVRRFEILTGQKIDPSECVGTLSKSAFESVYARYLLWLLDSPQQCPLRCLDAQIPQPNDIKEQEVHST